MNVTDPIRRVSVVSTGQVQIRPDHLASTWRPTYLWLLSSRSWTGPRPINAYVIEHRDGLDAGPAACGWNQDQRWTLARVAALIARLFGVSCTLRGVSYLLHRLGFTPQVPAHRAAEGDEDAIAAWRSQTWAKIRG